MFFLIISACLKSVAELNRQLSGTRPRGRSAVLNGKSAVLEKEETVWKGKVEGGTLQGARHLEVGS